MTWISLKSHLYATTEMVFINGNIHKREIFIKVTKMTVPPYYGMEKTDQTESHKPKQTTKQKHDTDTHKKRRCLNRIANCT